MRWGIVLLCLVGNNSYEIEAVIETDQDNFKWISQIFRSKANRQADCGECECGRSKVAPNPPDEKRIVGGKEVIKNSYPWMAALYTVTLGIYCGGAVINDRYILGAAHCNREYINLEDITVRLGAHDVDKDTVDDYTEYEVEDIIMHEEFNGRNHHNDIALYKLKKKIVMSDKVMPICLPKPDELFVGTMSTVIGWGRIKFMGSRSPFLREVDVPVRNAEDCIESLGKERMNEDVICAGYDEGRKDSCEGDSGGPLFYHDPDTKRTHKIGVVSFGDICGFRKNFGGYTRVNRYLDWIKSKTTDSCYCKDS